MSARLDLYIEKLIDKMNLDDVQRVDVEREVRSHLEEAIETGVAQGLSIEDSETEALVAFGQPGFLAKQFGSVWGTGWLLFERSMITLVLFAFLILLLGMPRNDTSQAEKIFVIFFYSTLILLACYGSLWSKVEVNGSLRIRRFLRSTLSIGFDQIRDVSFVGGHVLGKRDVSLGYDGGKLRLNSGRRGFRVVAFALTILCPDAIQPEVKNYFLNLTVKLRKETPLLKTLISGSWVVCLALFAFGIDSLWNHEGVPKPIIGSLILAHITAIFQAWLLADRAKRGTSWLQVLVFTSFIPILFLFSWLGDIYRFRHFAVAYLILLSWPFFTIWWSGRRFMQIAYSACVLVALPFSANLVPDVWGGMIRSLGTIESIPTKIAFIGETPPQIVSLSEGLLADSFLKGEGGLGSASAELVFWSTATEPKSHALPGYSVWQFDRTYCAETAVVKCGRFEETADLRQEFLKVESTEKLSEIKAVSTDYRMGMGSSAHWSPDATFCLLAKLEENDVNYPNFEMSIMESESETILPLDLRINTFHWINDQSIRAIELVSGDPESGARFGRIEEIKIWQIDVPSMETTLIARHEIEEDVHPVILEGARYATLGIGETDPFHLRKVKGFAIMDLDTGERIHLPDRSETNQWRSSSMRWSCEAERIVFIAEGDEGYQIVVASPTGVVAQLPFRQGTKIDDLKTSRDGSKVFFVERLMENILSSYNKYRIWDVSRNQVITIRSVSIFGEGILEGLLSVISSGEWTPDSRSLVYPAGRSLHIAYYEDWAEDVLDRN